MGGVIGMLVVSGCATEFPRSGSPGNPDSAGYWVAQAQQHEQAGDLQQARYEYRIAQTLSQKDRDIPQHIERLEELIQKKSRKLEDSAQKALRKGQTQRAQSLYLDILSLDPGNQQALESLRALDEHRAKQQLQAKYPNRTRKPRKSQDDQELRDEDYAYSRQSILQAEDRARNASGFIKELEAHVEKYPQDDELRKMLLNVRLSKAQQAFDRQDYLQSLQELQRAENSLKGDPPALSSLGERRKSYAKALYLEGVRRIRENRDEAVEIWQLALKFNPQDRKIQLRIRNAANP
ncbi:MAG: hypothetical protein ABW095_12330 [Candidatus Thiodiazotropha sp.]